MSLVGPRLLSRLEDVIWGTRLQALPAWQSRGLRFVRTALILARDLTRGQLTLRAMSLVYTTLLSLVPLLALSFSVLKAFGVYNQIQPLLLNFLSPLGEKGEEVARKIVQFIENMNVGVLGAVGLALLVYTAVSLMQKIEESLNFIWHVPQHRRLGERFSRYLSALTVGPILVVAALGMTASLMNIDTVQEVLAVDALGQAAKALGRLAPYLLVIATFTFIYQFIPNTHVRFGPALAGGVVGGIVWQTAGWAFALFVASSGKYAAIYSSFAILVLFMIWLYASWLVLLFGASVAFYVQHPEYLHAGVGEPRLSNRMRERLALWMASLVAGRFLAGDSAPSLEVLARELGVPVHALKPMLDTLERNHLVVQSAGDPPGYLPAREPTLIRVTQVLDAVRGAGEEQSLSPDAMPVPPVVEATLDQMTQATIASVGGLTLRDLAAPRAEHRPDERPGASR